MEKKVWWCDKHSVLYVISVLQKNQIWGLITNTVKFITIKAVQYSMRREEAESVIEGKKNWCRKA